MRRGPNHQPLNAVQRREMLEHPNTPAAEYAQNTRVTAPRLFDLV